MNARDLRQPGDPPTIDECRALLEPHRHRKVRVVVTGGAGLQLSRALFDVIYHETPACDHRSARRVEAELSASDRTVGDVLDGWRPPALGATVKVQGGT